MNTTMADGASERLVAQIGEAMFGQPGLTLMELAEKVKQHDLSLDQTITERDRYQEVADELAGHIAAITGVDIGEHSSANCPWQNAIEAAEEYQPAQPSPAGEADPLPPVRMEQPLRGDEPIGEQHDARMFNRGWNACREDAAALAARQPVNAAVKDSLTVEGGEAVAWMTHHDEPMLYPTFSEAAAYCNDDEPPIPLYSSPTTNAVGPMEVIDQIAKNWDGCSIGAAIRAEAKKLFDSQG